MIVPEGIPVSPHPDDQILERNFFTPELVEAVYRVLGQGHVLLSMPEPIVGYNVDWAVLQPKHAEGLPHGPYFVAQHMPRIVGNVGSNQHPYPWCVFDLRPDSIPVGRLESHNVNRRFAMRQ